MSTVRVRFAETTTELREMEVSVPWHRIFRASADDFMSVYYVRVEEDPERPGGLRTVGLHHTKPDLGDDERWEVEVKRMSSATGDGDYVMGRGAYALSAEEWEAQRDKMETWMRSVGALTSPGASPPPE